MTSNKKYISLDISGYRTLTTKKKNAFVFYVTLQLKYNNNIIKNATLDKLSKLSGVTKNSITEYKRILMSWGYIQQKDKDLIIIPQEKHKKTKFKLLFLYRSLNFNKVKELIELNLIKIHLDTQEYRELNKSIPKYNNKNKKLRKLLLAHKSKIVGGNVYVSSRSLAKVLGVSHNTVMKIIRKANDDKLVSYSERFKLHSTNITFKEFKSITQQINKFNDKFTFFKYSNNNIYYHCGLSLYNFNTCLL